MKKLIPLLLFFSIFPISCEKERCWKCAWDAGYTKETTVCDKTEKEIVAYEKEMSFTTETGQYVKMSCQSY